MEGNSEYTNKSIKRKLRMVTGLVFLLAVSIFFVVCFIMKKNTDDVSNTDGTKKIYIAMGDSIVYGYGLPDIETQRFSSIITSGLNQNRFGYKNSNNENKNGEGKEWISYNYGVNGLTSDGLLEMLKHGDIDMIQNADLITICIGTNDGLLPLESFLMIYSDMFFWCYEHGVDSPWESNSDDSDFQDGSKAKFKKGHASSVADKESWNKESFQRDYKNLTAQVDEDIQQLKENLIDIVQEIRKVNPDGRIIFMTLYNPYFDFDCTVRTSECEINLKDFSNKVINDMNQQIILLAGEYDCEIADVCQAFEDAEIDVLNAEINENGINFDDHPNKEGHKLIAETVLKIILE